MKAALGVAPTAEPSLLKTDPTLRSPNTIGPSYYAFEINTKEILGPFNSLDEALNTLNAEAHAGLWTITLKIMNHRVFRVVQ